MYKYYIRQFLTYNGLFRLICITLISFLLIKNSAATEPEKRKIQTVVIDPGHGGRDPGAVGSKYQEKEIVLAIALKLGNYIEKHFSDVTVIYTRKEDVFVPLHERAAIANKNNADIFISIHANANERKDVYGTETFFMGLHKSEENLEVAKLENSVILMEEDYEDNYGGFDPNSVESYIELSITQQVFNEQSLELADFVEHQFAERARRHSRGVKQAGFMVLWQTTMPSILVETGFISNENEEAFLASEQGQDYLASAIFRAFRDYKNTIERRTQIASSSVNPSEIKIEEEQVYASTSKSIPDNKIRFKVQVTASSKNIPLDSEFFKGLSDVEEFRLNEMYKYAVGEADSYEGIETYCKTVKEYFPDAFIIAVRNNRIIPVKEALEALNN